MTIKNTLLLALLCLCCITANAQTKSKSFFGVSVGAAIPTSDFGNNDFSADEAGLAKVGLNLDLNLGYMLTEDIGLAGLVRGQINGVSTEQTELLLKLFSSDNWKIESGKWTSVAAMAGIYTSFPIKSRATLDLKGMIGYLNITKPYLNVSNQNTSSPAYANQPAVSAGSIGFLVGTSLKIDMGKNLLFLTNLDWMTSSPEFKNIISTGSAGTNVQDLKMTYGTFNITCGLAFLLK